MGLIKSGAIWWKYNPDLRLSYYGSVRNPDISVTEWLIKITVGRMLTIQTHWMSGNHLSNF